MGNTVVVISVVMNTNFGVSITAYQGVLNVGTTCGVQAHQLFKCILGFEP